MSNDRKLKETQKEFCRRYIVHLNATRAAEEAGYATGQAASVRGSKLLKDPRIQSYIRTLQRDAAERAKVEPAEVIKEVCKSAFLNIKDFEPYLREVDGDISELLRVVPRELAASINAITVIDLSKNRRKITLQLNDKTSNLRLLAQLMGLLNGENVSATTRQGMVRVEDLKLSLEKKRELLAAIRSSKQGKVVIDE